jgi:hypothetical protein
MTGDPYSFFDDTRDNGSTRTTRGDASARGRWMDDVRRNDGTELAPGIRGDGNQRVLRSQDGHIVIYNYGTINFSRKEACGGVDYRDGDSRHDYREQIPYARDQRRPRNPQTYSVGDDCDDFSEEQFDRWQNAYLERANRNNLAQRNFSERTYPQQYFGPQQPGIAPQGYYLPRPYYPYQDRANGVGQTIDAIGRVALPLAMLWALSRGRGSGGLLALGLNGNGGIYADGQFGSSNNFYGGNVNGGSYYDGGYFPGTYRGFQYGGTQYVPNNAYAWQNANYASQMYSRRPYYPPDYYSGQNGPPGYVQGWDQNYAYS